MFSPNNTIKSYIDPETYVCQCEMCPDQTIQKKKSDGSFWCPCECQDGSIQEQLTDGTCNCTCPCLDGTNDTLSSDGTCSCECMCKNCKKSMRTSYGCYCPAEQFACPNGDKIKWENCLPQCEQRNPCGSYPFCLGDLTGVNCNIPNCPGCKNGFCKKSLAGTCSSLCACSNGWSGKFCDVRVTNSFGDVHFETFDHRFYDFQGLGEFWYCLDRKNDFGIQIRSYVKTLFDSVSWIGGVAIKLENNTFTQFLNDSLPISRINGEIIKITTNTNFNLSQSENILISFETTDDKSTTAIDVKDEFSLTIRYFMRIFQMEISLKNSMINTSGLCGSNDGNPANDFLGPTGSLYDDEWKFGKSWEVNKTNNSNNLWNWKYSNFNPLDIMDDRFNEAYLMQLPIGKNKLSYVSNETLEYALLTCKRNDLTGTLLDMCVLDVTVGGVEFAEDETYKVEQCPNRCNGKGKCVGFDKCECIEGWSGNSCEISSCVKNCGDNGQCVLGFCECNDGWDGDNCNKRALCGLLSNCTNENHGICRKNNECKCNDGFDGLDCSQTADCKNVNNCSG